MSEETVTVAPEEGLHARPGAQFVEMAQRFAAEVSVEKGDRTANAKSLLAIMTLGARKGDEITIRAEGRDADEAVAALVELISATAASNR